MKFPYFLFWDKIGEVPEFVYFCFEKETAHQKLAIYKHDCKCSYRMATQSADREIEVCLSFPFYKHELFFAIL